MSLSSKIFMLPKRTLHENHIQELWQMNFSLKKKKKLILTKTFPMHVKILLKAWANQINVSVISPCGLYNLSPAVHPLHLRPLELRSGSSGFQLRTYHLHSRWGKLSEQIRNIRLLWRPKRVRYGEYQNACFVVTRREKRHCNPSWSRASRSAPEKKGSLSITWLFLFGHMGGPVCSIGRTLWLSRD